MKPDSIFIQLNNATYYKGNTHLFDSLNWTIRKGECWAIVGGLGSGKTSLAEAITGKLFLRSGEAMFPFLEDLPETPDIHEASYLLSFQEESHVFNYANFYYQQRFHATETAGIITARDYLLRALPDSESILLVEELSRQFGITEVLPLEFIKLSNGQTRKLRIIKALLQKPALLVLDNPFAGLDASSRKDLHKIIDQLVVQGIHLLLTSYPTELPQSITHVLWLDKLQIKGKYSRKEFLGTLSVQQNGYAEQSQLPFLANKPTPAFETVIQFKNVQVAYEGKKALQHINWTVKKGEKWALLGPNGSGKSTLLSLIAADHPQAYANHIELFGKRRGSGESIWDIKQRIGFVSPELHLYFKTGMTSREVAATGFRDVLTLNRQITEEENNIIIDLFHYYNMESLLNRRFQQLSSGEQRIILLIRSLVKNPDLIIWDEPFQNVDNAFINQSSSLLQHYCQPDTTLLFVSHYAHEIPGFITRYLFLEKGIIRKMAYYSQKPS
ncbi:ATP-binding cassette domain-containing protein [Rhodocytophaga rosea]|uniref:ATP-binding cassette domain-containing protein n=1 Tax=Rhodocytophaga rosea TaxID=2704465 RepID=A0A6C0GUB9_9BACT|nr:ATP-binding cassette domain-containing protein [Rhodocytophaga rosea]QHT70960.1 ATP-binding cassette domain-containing protein [Rhodocytophaga rosea]